MFEGPGQAEPQDLPRYGQAVMTPFHPCSQACGPSAVRFAFTFGAGTVERVLAQPLCNFDLSGRLAKPLAGTASEQELEQ